MNSADELVYRKNVTSPLLTYRRIDPVNDGSLAYLHYRDACSSSFGDASSCMARENYLHWLGQRVDEFPDGHVMAMLDERVIGQLELQAPYGKSVGYVNLFYVVREWRRLGFGRRLHEYADCYFRSWEVDCIELHVSPTNDAAVQFYRSLGYKLSAVETGRDRMWRMQRQLQAVSKLRS